MPSKDIKCAGCGVVITAVLSDVGSANPYLCLECSGATLEDFLEEGVTEEDYLDNEVQMARQFHGKD